MPVVVRKMILPGLTAHPEGALVDRALQYLAGGPAGSETLTRQVLGIPQASAAVADRLVAAVLGAVPRVGRLHDGRWALVGRAQGSPAIAESAFAVVDVETTGGAPRRGDRITELAVAVVQGGRAEMVYGSLVNPERLIPQAVTVVTRISNGMVRNGPTFAEIADDVFAALAGRVFVAHNAAFDWRFLSSELRRVRGLVLDGPRLCTVKLARRLIPGLRSRSLDSVAGYFGIEMEERHRAGPDALATARILQRLIALAVESGAQTFKDLAALAEGRGRRRRRRRAHPATMDEA